MAPNGFANFRGVAWLVIRQTVRNAMVIMVQLDGKFQLRRNEQTGERERAFSPLHFRDFHQDRLTWRNS
jgi:hypothetical protein